MTVFIVLSLLGQICTVNTLHANLQRCPFWEILFKDAISVYILKQQCFMLS